jgi:hypothetical protein
LSVFLLIVFSKRSFVGCCGAKSSQKIVIIYKARLSVFLLIVFSKRSFVGCCGAKFSQKTKDRNL